MYISLEKKFLDKNLEKSYKEAKEEYGDDAENYLFSDTNDELSDIEIDDDELRVNVSNELGFFTVSIPLTTNVMEMLIGHTVGKLNKFKTMLQSLK